jgi:hypothetical protein
MVGGTGYHAATRSDSGQDLLSLLGELSFTSEKSTVELRVRCTDTYYCRQNYSYELRKKTTRILDNGY